MGGIGVKPYVVLSCKGPIGRPLKIQILAVVWTNASSAQHIFVQGKDARKEERLHVQLLQRFAIELLVDIEPHAFDVCADLKTFVLTKHVLEEEPAAASTRGDRNNRGAVCAFPPFDARALSGGDARVANLGEGTWQRTRTRGGAEGEAQRGEEQIGRHDDGDDRQPDHR